MGDGVAVTTLLSSVLVRRAITGLVLGTIAGMIELWIFNHDLAHFAAAVIAGPLYMTSLVWLTDRFQLAGGKTVHGAVAGLLTAIVWWAIAVRATEQFVFAAVAGACFGAVYVWSEVRKGP
jgi:hypothetical protein